MTDGKLSAEHVEVLAQAQHDVGEDIFALLEEGLVDAAVTERFVEFTRIVDHWVIRAKPADAEDRLERQVKDRGASSSSTLGGAGRVDVDFDPLSFPIWQAELGRLCEHLRDVDRAEARDRLGRAPLDHELGRTPRQRRVDAMRLMAERSAAYDGDLGPSSFCLNRHGGTDLVAEILARIIEALEANSLDGTVDLDDLAYDDDSLHELDDGTVITLNTILLALLTGTVRGVLFDPAGEVIRHGHARRLFTPAQAQAIRAKFWRCAHPYGCDRTHPFLQSDHVTEHRHGGCTDTDNGQCLCRAHNIWKTNFADRPPPPTDTSPTSPNEDARPNRAPSLADQDRSGLDLNRPGGLSDGVSNACSCGGLQSASRWAHANPTVLPARRCPRCRPGHPAHRPGGGGHHPARRHHDGRCRRRRRRAAVAA